MRTNRMKAPILLWVILLLAYILFTCFIIIIIKLKHAIYH